MSLCYFENIQVQFLFFFSTKDMYQLFPIPAGRGYEVTSYMYLVFNWYILQQISNHHC